MDAIQVLQNILDDNKTTLGDGLYLELSNAIMHVHRLKNKECIPEELIRELNRLQLRNEVSSTIINILRQENSRLERKLDEERTRINTDSMVQHFKERFKVMMKERDHFSHEVKRLQQECQDLRKQLGSLCFVPLDKVMCECGQRVHPLHMDRHMKGKKHLDNLRAKNEAE